LIGFTVGALNTVGRLDFNSSTGRGSNIESGSSDGSNLIILRKLLEESCVKFLQEFEEFEASELSFIEALRELSDLEVLSLDF